MTPAEKLDRGFFGQPQGLLTLFITEMWERMSYYGMRGLLVLFMTAAIAEGGLAIGTATAVAIYGLYTASAYQEDGSLTVLLGVKKPFGMAALSLCVVILSWLFQTTKHSSWVSFWLF